MTMRWRGTTTGLAILASTAFCLTACGGSSSSAGTTTTSTSAAAPTTSSAAASANTVAVTEKEFAISMPKTAFTAGTYTFTVNNAGQYPHNLTFEGPGVDKQASPTIPGGQSGEVTVTLKSGSYEVWCSVDSHKDKGMDIKITVT